MHRVPVRRLARFSSAVHIPSPSYTVPRFSSSKSDNTDHASIPGWKGRTPDDHAVHRKDRLDVQSDASQSGMEEHQTGESGSQGLNRKDDGQYNKKAEKDHPEAPQPVIGMNDERKSRVRFVTLPLLTATCRRAKRSLMIAKSTLGVWNMLGPFGSVLGGLKLGGNHLPT